MTLYSTDFESGDAGWAHSGISDTWVLTGTRAHSGVQSFHAKDLAWVSDQRLASPQVALPAGLSDLTLQFWNHQTLESNGSACWDGGILEVSTDGGGGWTQVTSGLLTDPYNGVVNNGSGNPLGGLDAWCGDPQDWLNSVVDLNAYAGQSVNFRFRLGSDTIFGEEGWYIDDVVVQGCETTPMTYTVSANTVGSGSITADPAQPFYNAGDFVTMTAAADPGWVFAGWSGDLSGTDPSGVLFINADKAVTATFEALTYTLNVATTGSGSVLVEPAQPFYTYGDVVTLTATPDPGWAFNGWSGDLSGGANPQTLVMDGNKAVSADFAVAYTLDVSLVGSGAVGLDPTQSTYASGDVVTLTATPAPGWLFSGWSGALSGTANPQTITMDGNKTVTATFTAESYTLNISVTGSGSVTASPDQATYQYGDTITLTAVAALGWAFVGWGGDLSGTANPQTVTIEGDMNVVAIFEEQAPTERLIYLPLIDK